MFIIKEEASNHTIQEKFQHFGDTISHMFHEVCTLLLHLHVETVNLSTKDDVLYPQIVDNTKYFPYFQNCLSLLDGIYIAAYILAINGAAYQN